METWKLESNTIKYFVLSSTLFFVGGILMYRFRDFDTTRFSDFYFGLCVFVLSIPRSDDYRSSAPHPLHIEGTTLFGKKEKTISADTIESARVSFIGKASNFIENTYYISLHMRDGFRFPLFLSGYYDGRGSENALREQLTRLRESLGIELYRLTAFVSYCIFL